MRESKYREMSAPERAQHVFGYHAGTPATIPVHIFARDRFRTLAIELSDELDMVNADPRDMAYFWTKLQEASMAFHAALAFTAPTTEP